MLTGEHMTAPGPTRQLPPKAPGGTEVGVHHHRTVGVTRFGGVSARLPRGNMSV